MAKIQLGDKVKCKYTGFMGIAVARIQFINGCTQYTVAPKYEKGNKLFEDYNIDEESLIVISTKKVKKIKSKKPPGGAMRKASQRRNY